MIVGLCLALRIDEKFLAKLLENGASFAQFTRLVATSQRQIGKQELQTKTHISTIVVVGF
jgi:hypothetical protein